MPKADLVLEGGGVKGLGLVGAVMRMMEDGYTFPRVAGTSAGSIVAAFVAAGLDRDGFGAVMDRLRYSKVPDRGAPRIPGVSEGVSLLRDRGAFEGDYIHRFMSTELEQLGIRTFKDLRRRDNHADASLDRYHRYKLVVMATDVTNGRLLRLPWDYELLGLEPDDQLVADAVRASIAIPLFFDPVVLCDDSNGGSEITLVDGGILSNFPIEIFDRTDGETPRWPTLGVKLIPDLPQHDGQLLGGLNRLPVPPVVRLLQQVLVTAVAGHDQTYLNRPSVKRRTIRVSSASVGIVEFKASAEKRAEAVRSGHDAADAFLAGWDWEEYRREFRGVPVEA